jgi:Rod binding domain-containing protein
MERILDGMSAPVWSAMDLSNPALTKARAPREVAQQFEALLVAQLLSSARQAGGSGWLGTGEENSESGLAQFAEHQVALLIAQGGGLGLARTVEEAIRNHPKALNPGRAEVP